MSLKEILTCITVLLIGGTALYVLLEIISNIQTLARLKIENLELRNEIMQIELGKPNCPNCGKICQPVELENFGHCVACMSKLKD